MKKFLAILFSALFVLSFAASAFAIHAEIPAETQATVAKGSTQITLGGEIRTRGWWIANSGTADVANAAWLDERVRLSIDANVAPGVTGYVQIETRSETDGDKYTWGNGAKAVNMPVGGRLSDSVAGNAKPDTQLDILQAWILYTGQGLLGIPAGLKVGHMPLQLGFGNFFNNTQYGDDAIVFFMDPMKEMHVGLLSVKLGEGFTSKNGDDTEAYVALATYKLDAKNTIGINFTYANNSDLRLKLQNLGLHAGGDISGLGYKIEGDFQFGSVDPTHVSKIKFSGAAASLALNYKIDPINLRLAAAMGSGDGDATDNKYKEFIAFTGNTQNYSFIYEYLLKTTAQGGLNPAAPSDGHAAGFANTTMLNLGFDYNATKEIGLGLDGYMFRATKTSVPNGSKNAGWEVDAKMTYAVAKNLNYQIDAGYFNAGKYYDTVAAKAKDVKALRHVLTLSF